VAHGSAEGAWFAGRESPDISLQESLFETVGSEDSVRAYRLLIGTRRFRQLALIIQEIQEVGTNNSGDSGCWH
jgi:hypothetical protein